MPTRPPGAGPTGCAGTVDDVEVRQLLPDDVIRCAVVVADRSVPSWQRRVIEELGSVDGVELTLVIAPGDAEPVRRARSGRLRSRRGAAPQVVRLPDDLRAEHAQGITADVVLHLGGRPPASMTDRIPPLGWWSLRHGRPVRASDPPCTAEILDGDPVTTVSLVRRTAAGEEALLSARVATIPHSPRRQYAHVTLATAPLPAMACAQVLADPGWADRNGHSSPEEPEEEVPRDVPRPLLATRLARNFVVRQWTGLVRADRWHVGIAPRPISSFLDRPTTDDVVWLPRPAGSDRYVADPFGGLTSDGAVVLVEDYDHRERHGRLSAFRLAAGGDRPTGPVPVATFPTHVSYPYLVEVDGDLWCLPEMAAAGEVRAYRLDPRSLELEDLGPLLEGVALSDPTMFPWQGRWWLVGTDYERGPNSHLRGWWADHPRGPWRPHPVDPLLIDVQGARGAGTPFVDGGRLYRPAQDCSSGYGSAVVLKRVERLDPHGFAERAVARVAPPNVGPYRHGCHTLSELGERTLVDAVGRRFSAAAFRHELGARFGGLVRR